MSNFQTKLHCLINWFRLWLTRHLCLLILCLPYRKFAYPFCELAACFLWLLTVWIPCRSKTNTLEQFDSLEDFYHWCDTNAIINFTLVSVGALVFITISVILVIVFRIIKFRSMSILGMLACCLLTVLSKFCRPLTLFEQARWRCTLWMAVSTTRTCSTRSNRCGIPFCQYCQSLSCCWSSFLTSRTGAPTTSKSERWPCRLTPSGSKKRTSSARSKLSRASPSSRPSWSSYFRSWQLPLASMATRTSRTSSNS